ncbi:MAG: alanine--tRNA ligase, partial [Crocinitomicaceae bacterium]|nr:alanine--tRNA ligase [Crocinitomicaceae bacterium]
GGSIKDILFQLKGEVDNFFGVIGGNEGDKCTISIIAADSLIADKGINAGNIVREVSKHIQGGGGGQAFFATAGGKNPNGLKDAIADVKAKITN